MSAASEITRKAESNLAFALKILPKDRRDDMVIFYAFCRTIDDVADEAGASFARRAEGLDTWENGIRDGFPEDNELGRELMSMIARREVSDEQRRPVRVPADGQIGDAPPVGGHEQLRELVGISAVPAELLRQRRLGE